MKEIEIQGVNEKIYHEVLDCGLPIYIWENKKVNGYYLSFSTRFGSIHTDYKFNSKYYELPKGTAHFLEHLKFNEKDGSAQDFYEKMGSDVNAFTTFEYTSYEVYGTHNVDENLDHLLDFVLTPYFTSKMVENEKGIIVEENKRDQDNPANKLYYGSLRQVFQKNNRRYYITGAEEDIKSTTLDDIQNAFDAFYHPQNMFLVVTGNVNAYDVVKIARENLATKEFLEYQKPTIKKYKEPMKVSNDYLEEESNVEIPKMKYTLKIPVKNFKEIDEMKLRIIVSLILDANFGVTSDLLEDLRSKNLVLYLGKERAIIDGYLTIGITVETNYPHELIPILDEAFKNLSIDEAIVKRKIKSAVANMVLSYDDITSVNSIIQDYLINYQKIITNNKEVIEKIKFNEVKYVLNNLNTNEKSILILKPKNRSE